MYATRLVSLVASVQANANMAPRLEQGRARSSAQFPTNAGFDELGILRIENPSSRWRGLEGVTFLLKVRLLHLLLPLGEQESEKAPQCILPRE